MGWISRLPSYLGRATARRGGVAAAVVAVALLAGCATEGADVASLGPLTAGKARVVVSRPASIVYAGSPATIALNGTKVASVGSGGSAAFDAPAGPIVIAASAWSYPGSSTLRLDARAGETIRLEVAPRDASVGAGILLGPLGGLVDGSTAQSGGAFDVKVVVTCPVSSDQT